MSQNGFTDRLLRGPFKHWVHRHNFSPLGEKTTKVTDEIEFELHPHPLWGPIGALMALGMPALFRYRAWKTRRILQADLAQRAPDPSISTR
jgi:ligand-binding SRPBCC domain-containing protein